MLFPRGTDEVCKLTASEQPLTAKISFKHVVPTTISSEIFRILCVLWILQDFADLLEIHSSVILQNIPDISNQWKPIIDMININQYNW